MDNYNHMLTKFGENIEELLNDKSITEEQFAKSIQIDVQEVYRFIRKERLPLLSTVIKIADCYNYSVDYLLGYKEFQEDAVYKKTPPFSEAFKKLLQNKNITRYKISKKANISINRLDEWYNGKRMISLDNAIKLKKYFDITLDELLGRI